MRQTCALVLSSLLLAPAVMADAESHRAAAERFLKLANAEGMTAPVYRQTEQVLAARFAQMGGSMQYESILREYRERAKVMLDEQLSWRAMRDEMIELYLPVFSEQEFEELAVFYQSPAGSKLMKHLPELTRASMGIARQRVEQVIAPQLEQLVADMAAEVEARQTGGAAGAE